MILVADVGQKSWEQVHEWHQCLHEAEWEIGGVSVCVCGGGGGGDVPCGILVLETPSSHSISCS